jgi:NTP pyrophosphatase (non-canonical NTP hydrolase)
MSTREVKTLEELAKQCVEDSEKYFGDSAVVYSIPHHALAMAGEVGEFCNLVKKVERGSLDIRTPAVRYDMAMELTDVFIYLLNLAGLLQIDLGKTYQMKRAENNKRFAEQRAERAQRNGNG